LMNVLRMTSLGSRGFLPKLNHKRVWKGRGFQNLRI
jgi:hypothetical protein